MTNWTTYAGSNFFSDYGPVQDVPLYLRFVVHSATNIDAYFSYGGLLWSALATGENFLVNATYVALMLHPYSRGYEVLYDSVRFS